MKTVQHEDLFSHRRNPIFKDGHSSSSTFNETHSKLQNQKQPKPKTHFENKTEEWLVKKKKVNMLEDEWLVDQFNCGYSGHIVVTGKIYITNKRVCFYSPFNDTNLFFESTFIQIPKQQIMKIQKKHNAKIFDNSIQITKKNLETVFFTSFVSRNKCFDLMNAYLVDQQEDKKNSQKSKRKSQYDYDTEFLASKIVFEEFQYLIHSFSCGLARKINIMGRMYITNRRIFFNSLFTEEGVSQEGTQINIVADDILKIEKRYNTLIFDNSILVITKKDSFFFTSFLARDKVFHILLDVFVYKNQNINLPKEDEQKFYDIEKQDQSQFYDIQEIVKDHEFGKGIQKLNESLKADFIEHENQIFQEIKLQPKKQSNIETYEDELDFEKVSEEQFRKIVHQNDDLSQEDIRQRQQQIMSMIGTENNLEVIGERILQFPGLNALKALRIFDSGQQFFIKGKKYEDFMEFFKQQIMNRKNIKISKWMPNVLEFLNTSNLKKNCPLQFERDMDEVVRLQKTGIPFMPKQAKSRQFQRLFIISKDKYLIESYVQNSGAPYSDTFHNNGRKVVQTISENTIKITVSMETVFKSKPFLSSLIENKCEQEGIKQQQRMFEAMKEYFKSLEQSKIKK